jgi:hypothetical protein
MSVGENSDLLEKLIENRSATRALLEDVDPEMRVYTDPEWRIREILGHIATWDRQVAKSLRAFRAGSDYFIPDIEEDESDFNEQAVLEQRTFSTQQIFVEWEQARDDLREAVRVIPSGQFPGDLLYPWGGERGSIAMLIDYMIDHEDEHRDEIEKAIKASAEN